MSTEMFDIASRYFDGDLSQDEFARLSAWIGRAPANADFLVALGMLERHMRDQFAWQHRSQFGLDAARDDGETWATLLEMESAAKTDIPEVDQWVEDPPRCLGLAPSGRLVMVEEPTRESSRLVLSIAGVQIYRRDREMTGRRRRMRRRLAWAAATAALFAMLAALYAPVRQKPLDDASPERPTVASSRVAATVARVIDVATDEADRPIQPGGTLMNGDRLILIRGSVELAMDSGVSVVLESPCDAEIRDGQAVLLHRGQLAARVPQTGRFFTVKTAAANIVDLGTEFDVEVTEDGRVATTVFEGLVELHPTAPLEHHDAIRINGGWRVEMDASGKVEQRVAIPMGLVTPHAVFDARVKASQGSAYHRWLVRSIRLRNDPHLSLYYCIENGDQTHALENRAAMQFGRYPASPPATPPTVTEGRWRQTRALNFAGQPSYLVVPGFDTQQYPQGYTIAAWIRLDPGRQKYNIIASQWGDASDMSGYRFEFMIENGTLSAQTAVEGDFQRRHGRTHQTPLKPDDGWVHIAMVVAADGELQLYRNGVAANTPMRSGLDAGRYGTRASVPGPAQPFCIGGKASGGLGFAGSIAEFMLFDQPLSDESIRQIADMDPPNP